MKCATHSGEQSAYELRQAESGEAAAGLCGQLASAEKTGHSWGKKYANLSATELRELWLLRAAKSAPK